MVRDGSGESNVLMPILLNSVQSDNYTFKKIREKTNALKPGFKLT